MTDMKYTYIAFCVNILFEGKIDYKKWRTVKTGNIRAHSVSKTHGDNYP